MANLWEKRSVGQPPSFSNPEDMWSKALEYFKWCEDNALDEGKVFCFQGEVVKASVSKMRAMTQAGLCAFLNISTSSWHNYKAKEEYLEVAGMIEEVMYEQKFTGAAAGLLSSNIIARDLGLADKQEIVANGDNSPWSAIKAKVDE